MGLSIASFSLGNDLPSSLVPFGLAVVPFALGRLVGKRTGVGLDLYRTTPGAATPGAIFAIAFVLVVIVDTTLQWGFDLPWAMAGAGVLVAVLTLIYSPRICAAMLEDLRAGKTGH